MRDALRSGLHAAATGRLARRLGRPGPRAVGLVATLCLLAAPPPAGTEPVAKVARIGVLVPGAAASPETKRAVEAFRRGLGEHGHQEGRTLLVEYRAADSKLERLPGLATELVRLKVDLIVAMTTPGARAAQGATATIPVVGSNMGDPVRDGLVASLGRPGGNVTGTTFLGPELVPKRLALLKEALPRASRVAVLWHAGAFSEPTMRDMRAEADASARALGLPLRFVEVRDAAELDRAFAAIARERADAVFLFPSAMLFTERRRLAALAATHRLPLLGNASEYAQAGALLAYGASVQDGHRRAAAYVDKILKGARPADLPVEQPTTFDLAINLKTARALGLTIAPAVLARADEVIR